MARPRTRVKSARTATHPVTTGPSTRSSSEVVLRLAHRAVWSARRLPLPAPRDHPPRQRLQRSACNLPSFLQNDVAPTEIVLRLAVCEAWCAVCRIRSSVRRIRSTERRTPSSSSDTWKTERDIPKAECVSQSSVRHAWFSACDVWSSECVVPSSVFRVPQSTRVARQTKRVARQTKCRTW